MFAVPTLRRRHRHGNVSIRWRPDRRWLLLVIVAVMVAGAVSMVLMLSLWYAP